VKLKWLKYYDLLYQAPRTGKLVTRWVGFTDPEALERLSKSDFVRGCILCGSDVIVDFQNVNKLYIIDFATSYFFSNNKRPTF